MKLFLEADGVTCEISDSAVHYQPDVLDDWANRASALVAAQRMREVEPAETP